MVNSMRNHNHTNHNYLKLLNTEKTNIFQLNETTFTMYICITSITEISFDQWLHMYMYYIESQIKNMRNVFLHYRFMIIIPQI